MPTRSKPHQPVTWLRTRETPQDSEVTRAAIAGLYGRYGRECISTSLREAERELAACKVSTRLIIYIHDGMPTDEYPATIVTVLKDIRRKGTLVVAPYVGEQSYISNLAAIFGNQWTIPVEQLPDLSKRLGRLLLKYAQEVGVVQQVNPGKRGQRPARPAAPADTNAPFIQQLGDRWGQKNQQRVNKKERKFSALPEGGICNAVNSLEKTIEHKWGQMSIHDNLSPLMFDV